MYIVHMPLIIRAALLSPFPEIGVNCAAKF